MTLIDFNEVMKDDFNDPEFVAAYLEECYNDSMETFLMGLGNVAKAHGIAKTATAAGVNRENLYRALSAEGNPEIRTIRSVLDVVGMQMKFGPKAA